MNNKIKNTIKVIFYPAVLARRWYIKFMPQWLAKHWPKKQASILYKRHMNGKKLDWKNPKDLNEKINWMKFNTDLTEWTRLSDKYRVREYVKERGREDLLVKLYGVWSSADEVNFESLPESFVLKSNHGCGTVIIVDDKKLIDIPQVRKTMNDWLSRKYGLLSVEPQYAGIKPLIIAEENLNNDNSKSSSIVDYKVWCFDGKPYCIMVCANRIIGKGTELAFYNLKWKRRTEMLAGSHATNDIEIEKPLCLSELLDAAEQLAKNHPEVRVDFYIVNNKVYFGEMTFTSLGGYMDYIAPKYLIDMGNKITLPKKTK